MQRLSETFRSSKWLRVIQGVFPGPQNEGGHVAFTAKNVVANAIVSETTVYQDRTVTVRARMLQSIKRMSCVLFH